MNCVRIRAIASLSAACAVISLTAARTGAQAVVDTTQVRAFAQAFYQWYVPLVLRHGSDPVATVLRDRPSSLTRELSTALRADAAGRAADTKGLAWLDEDPFTLTQDLCPRYAFGAVRRIGSVFRFEVTFCLHESYQHTIVAEVVRRAGAWQIANVYEPQGQFDLISTLRIQADERRNSPILVDPGVDFWRAGHGALVAALRDTLRRRNPKIDSVTVLEARLTSQASLPYLFIGLGIRGDKRFAGSLDDELVGLFAANDSLTRIVRVFEIMPTGRWRDYSLHIRDIRSDSVIVTDNGAAHGGQAIRRAYAITQAQTPTLDCDAKEEVALQQSHGAAQRVSKRRLTVRWAAGTKTFVSDSVQDFGSLDYWYCGFDSAAGFHLIHKTEDAAFTGILLNQTTGKVLPAGNEVIFAPDGSRYFASMQLDGHEGPDWYAYTRDGAALWTGQAEHPTGGLDRSVGILEKPRWTAKGALQATLRCPGGPDTWSMSTVTLTRSSVGWAWLPSLKCRRPVPG
jgi:hypothetical protein